MAVIVVWSEEYDGEGEIHAADGSLLSTFNFGFSSESTPKNVVTLADDSFAVLWYGYKDEGEAANGGTPAFYGQIMGSGEPFEIGSAPGRDPQPSVARLSDGNFVVIWQDDPVGLAPEVDPDGTNLIGRIFSPSGDIIGAPFIVNSTLVGDQFNADVAALSDGRFVVTWHDTTGEAGVPGAGSAIRAQIFDSDGSFIGDEFLVNTSAAFDQGDPSVAGLGDDRFVITWTDGSGEGGDIADGGIKAQLFAVEVPEDETIVGTNASEQLDGGFGNDDISGREGVDTVFAGAGDDLVKGDKGEDILYGGLNNDTLIGGWQNDQLYGGVGDDILYGDLTGQIGRGSRGANDMLHGGDGNDTLYGDAPIIAAGGRGGNDHLYGGRGDDFIYGDGQPGAGGGGRDRIDGGFGNDQLWGGGGDDRFVFNGLSGSDIIWDFGDNDVIDLRGTEAGDPTNEPLQINFVDGNAELRFNGGFIKVIGVTSFDSGDILVT